MHTLTMPTILKEPLKLPERGVSAFTGDKKSTRSQMLVLLKQSMDTNSRRVRWWADGGVDFESYTTMDFAVTISKGDMSLTHKVYEDEITYTKGDMTRIFNKSSAKLVVHRDQRLFALEARGVKFLPEHLADVLDDIDEVTEYIKGTVFLSCYLSKPEAQMRLAGYETYEVFSHGENVGDILKSIPMDAQEGFDIYMKEHFGFTVYIKDGAILVNDGTKPRNVVYAGSSVWTQVVVGIQLWMVTYKAKVSRREVTPTRTVVLEHPDRMLNLKAKLGLAQAIQRAGKEVHVMVETSDEAFAYMLQQN